MNDIIRYIIQFLVGNESPAGVSDLIGYTSDESSFYKYKIIIFPSGFFDEKIYGTIHSMPALPLKLIDDVPVLFGQPVVEQKDGRLIVYADIIAGSFFLMSRYEETIRRDVRDEHGRFPGKESLPFRAGFMDRPVIDEYGRLLRNWLTQLGVKVGNPKQTFRQINLTHDVDAPFSMRTWRNIARGIKERKNIRKILQTKFGPPENDPYYTFPWLLNKNKQVQNHFGKERCSSIFFFKAGGNEFRDKPRYNLFSRDIRELFKLISASDGVFGLHSSYQAGKCPDIIPEEKIYLEKAVGVEITANRHHFLTLREPEDMLFLEQAGITDDYTMGYADIAGFRLGTCYPVRWIDVTQRRLSSLLLHPLTVMDSTLIESKYMGLSYAEAADCCFNLIRQVEKAGGELSLLWHNSWVTESSGYLRKLYALLIKYLAEKPF